ncbi:DMT family transporter [Aureibacillus halotolerans]|uniref:Putative membrane protein n=1 Tax=Aureibacillus halotolerans TaxID=1508390 RepID=A0A4R6UDT6_9BACI|nr:DMT family transporter [Aureibacillus halotolerans]TDQ42965.1 putative membrane protein [Aureibacillus halotolerans]
MQQRNHTFWLIVIGAAFWGATPVFRMLLLDSMTSTQIVLIEHIVLALVTAPILYAHRHELASLNWRDVGALLFISWGGSAVASLLFTQGLTYGDMNAVLLLQKVQPIAAILLARVLLKEKLPKQFSFLFPLALVGTYFLTFGFSFPLNGWGEVINVGSLYSLGAAVLWGGATVMGRILLKKLQFETVTSLRFLLALPMLVLLYSISRDAWTLPTEATALTMIAVNLLISALLPGLLSMMLYYKGLGTMKASTATLAELSFPMTGLLVNWLVFQQEVTFAQMIGFLLIWIALFLISRQKDAASPVQNGTVSSIPASPTR